MVITLEKQANEKAVAPEIDDMVIAAIAKNYEDIKVHNRPDLSSDPLKIMIDSRVELEEDLLDFINLSI